MGAFHNTLNRESTWDGIFGSWITLLEILNLLTNIAKHIPNVSNCSVLILKDIIVWNSIT